MSHGLNTSQLTERQQALAAYEILDTPAEAAFDDFTRLATQICETPIALISLLDTDRQWFKSKVGIALSETPLALAFCTCTVLNDKLLEIPDLTLDERFKKNPFVVDGPKLRFYAGVPLITPQGARIGALCVADLQSRRLTAEQRDALVTLGRHVVHQLELRLAGLSQKKLNEELARKAAFQDALLESVSTAIVCVSPDGVVTHFNTDAEQLLGYQADEIVGRQTPLLWHDSREIHARARVFSLHYGSPVIPGFGVLTARLGDVKAETREWTLLHKDGMRLPALVTVSVMHDSQGRRIGYLFSARDLTELKKIEAQRERFFTLSLDLLGVATMKGYFVRINPAFAAVLGYTQDELLEKPFINFVEPEDRAATEREMEKLAGGQATLNFENRYRCKDGSTKWISWKVQPFPSEGLLFCTGRDVSVAKSQDEALKASESQLLLLNQNLGRLVAEKTGELERQKALLSLILENLSEGVLACDADGHITFLNRSARHWHPTVDTQGAPATWPAAYGLHHKDGVTPMMMEELPLWRALHGEHVHNFEMSIVRRESASVVHVLATSNPLLNGEGKNVGAVCILNDITERKRVERNAERAHRLESIGTLASGVAHDLSNILSPILLFTGVIKAKYPEDIKMIEAMESGARRGVDMVRQLLTFAKGSDSVEKPVRSRTLLDEMKKFIEATFPKNITLRAYWPAGLPPVLGDATQLHQVLLNLCINARDAMPNGGTLSLEADHVVVDESPPGAILEARPGRYVVWQVRDTGTGIPPAMLERIFEPFVSMKAASLGSGLGLSTVLGVVRSHRGFIRVLSQLGKGSNFMIYLPAISSARQEPSKPDDSLYGKGETILVVDDERSVREAVAAMLEALNYRVIKAANGVEALVKAGNIGNELKAVITDLRMPQMDGFELTREFKALNPDLPVLVMSGRLNRATIEKFKEQGVSVFLDKPFSPEVLIKHIRSAIPA